MAKQKKGALFGTGSSLVAALTIGAWGAGAVQAAHAQDAEEDIVVTGSYIRGTPEDAALPVDVISAQDLQQQGSPQALDLIKSLPIVGPVLGDSNQFSAAAQGASGAGTLNLRGIGASRTLVLLNGRRIGPSLAGAVDTNLLPVNAIGRIEILKDGAAATYGSDAIAGVANFITRRDLEGLEVAGEYRAIEGSDGDWTGALNWGWRGDRSNVFVSVGYQHRSELTSLDRDWANRPYTENPTGWSVLGNPGAFLPLNGATPTAGVTRDANCNAVGGFATFSGATAACYFTYVPYDNLVEEQDQSTVKSTPRLRTISICTSKLIGRATRSLASGSRRPIRRRRGRMVRAASVRSPCRQARRAHRPRCSKRASPQSSRPPT